MFSRQSSLLHPQLPGFQNAVAPPIFLWPSGQWEHCIELGGETLLDLCSSVFFFPELTTAPASLALGVPPSASALRRRRGVCPGTEAGATRGHEAAPLLHPASCPQERSVGMLASHSERLS